MKKIIWTFEKEEDYKEFMTEIVNIPAEAGFIESEGEDSVVVRITNLKK